MGSYGPRILGVPERAITAHADLLAVIEDTGPTPCSREPELWWDDAAAVRAQAADACLDCPAFTACRRYYALAREKQGVWAGTDTTPKLGRRKKVAA